MRRRRVFRGLIVALCLLILFAALAALFPGALAQGIRGMAEAWPVVTPPPPTITAPPGPLPAGTVGRVQWVQPPGADFQRVETSGFLLQIPNGPVVGVTTAHSLFQEDPHRRLERVALGLNGQPTWLVESDTYLGPPGVPFAPGALFAPEDFTVDYVLLKLPAADPALALAPDPRGAPQPGERVTLFSGLGDGAGGPYRWAGTVLSVQPKAVVVYMDAGDRSPAGMSGSPVLSQYTGQVVGMALGAALRRDRWLIGLHPVGHLVELAQTATVFPRIADFVR